jgi:tryptophanyl-tRNA synthetase
VIPPGSRSGSGSPAPHRRVFSGIQPSGDVHLGNYLGAIKRWVDGQREKENYFCIVDFHSLTVPQDAEDLRRQTRSLAALLLAAGLDPGQCTLFLQSHVRAHADVHVPGHAIRVLDEPDEIRRTVARAVTDSGNEIRFSDDPARAGVSNLLGIYQTVTGKAAAAVEADFAAARGYGDLKRRVADAVVAELTPIRERHAALMRDPAALDRFLARGAERARAIAEPKLAEMKRRMGLIPPA